jgi:Carboxypeptidase regulatory-like domain
MKRSFAYLAGALFIIAMNMGIVLAQGTNGSLSGSVSDPKGAVVAGATIVVTNTATNQEFTSETNEDGTFNVPALPSGVYTAKISGQGFKQSVVTDIKVDVGKPSNIAVTLEIGSASETVTVMGGGELLQTQSTTIGTTLTGRQITDLPTASRDALDLVLALPGTTTVGRPRSSSVNGLPKGALNITLDGLNVQDNLGKSNDGFFTYIRPRTDAISEVTVSTTTPGAESSAEGAVQIKFVTQGGANEYHGGVYWYHRNPALNANYWFNNRDLPPDPVTGKAPQSRILLNQPGGKIGGPISIPGLFNGKDKAFFFINYEEFRLPERTLRNRNILSTEAQSGIYRFLSPTFTPPAGSAITCTGTGASRICSVNVYTLAGLVADCNSAVTGNQPCLTTPDPTVGSLLTSIRTSLGSSTIRASGDPNIQQVSFVNPGGQVRKFPTVRFDFNAGNNHHFENIWNYQQFRNSVDFLNGNDPQFPGFPNTGSQDSNRFSNSSAWRWTISQNLVNEARYAFTGGTSLFAANVNSNQFENQGGYNLSLGNFASGNLTLSTATATNAPSRRHTPVRNFSDTLNWIKGNHSLNFGGNFTKITYWNQAITPVQTAVFTTSQTLDPSAFAAFNTAANPLPATQQSVAAQLYYLLSGRLTAVNANARLNEDTLKYKYLGDLSTRAMQKEWGLFVQDSWRFRPNLTLNFGLRWEVQLPFEALNDVWAGVSYAGLFGESGEGNLFKPGTLTGSPSQYTLFGNGSKAYNTDYTNFAPTVGLAYSPDFKTGFLHTLAGDSGKTVIRAGYSRAFNREGVGVFTAVTGSNPGGTLTTNRNLTLGNLPVGTYLRQGPFAPPSFPESPVYPNTGLVTDSVNAFLPDLKVGHIDSWTVGVQRELTSDTVLEVRYIGNRGRDLWRQYDLNELNIIENGVFDEWKLAQANLLSNIACANTAGCTGGGVHFRFRGPGTGTFPLPISLAYFTGLSSSALNPNLASSYTAANTANFANSTYYNTMNPLNPTPLTFGANLSSTAFDSRRTCTGTGCTPLFPYNHFLVNAGKRGGSYIVDNSGETSYDALTIELRRRLSKGLLIQSSYTFGKALANMYASSSSVYDQPTTIRDPNLRKGVTPFDITHSFKANFIYELPVGRGQKFLGGSSGLVNGFLGGWGFNGNIRIQSGNPYSLGNVQLVGMDKKELQDAVGVYRDPDGFIYVLPKDIRDNTVKANLVGISTTAPFGPNYTQGPPSGRFIAPAGFGNCQQSFGYTPSLTTPTTGGGCGFANLVLKGPSFFRSDLSIVKKVRFSERLNLEMRGEFLNAFNNINFLVGSAGNDVNTLTNFTSSAFGRMTAAYQDISTTNDPGGRLVQLVLRLNF